MFYALLLHCSDLFVTSQEKAVPSYYVTFSHSEGATVAISSKKNFEFWN